MKPCPSSLSYVLLQFLVCWWLEWRKGICKLKLPAKKQPTKIIPRSAWNGWMECGV